MHWRLRVRMHLAGTQQERIYHDMVHGGIERGAWVESRKYVSATA